MLESVRSGEELRTGSQTTERLSHFVLSHVRLCNTLDCSSPGSTSTGFPRQETWSGFPFPPPGDLPNPGSEPTSPVSPELQADS